ncbi:MetQ/NlpA family ABC transporter substrate-binding protein [Desulfovibrio sp. OttesenSCG-928-F07]|nr:MetQ/NlpA family ABC transporter substrate-binding protein [Desulfovibrio sp. OttesenSCG-928-F07]
MLKRLFYCMLIVASFMLTACSENEKQANKDKVDSVKQSLTLGVMPSMDYLPVAVALREGYYAQNGLDITIMKFYSANERDAAFQSYNVDGVVIDYTGAVLQKNGGFDLALTSRCDAPFHIVASKQSNIKTLADLKGAKIAVSQNTVIDYCIDMALKSVGLSAANVEKVEINKIPVRFEMLMGGKIDCTGLPDPLALISKSGGATELTTNSELGLSITGIMFTGKAMQEKAELIKKMYAGYNMAVEYLETHDPEDVKDILIDHMGFKPELIANTTLPVYTKAALPPEEDLQSVINWLAERGLVNPELNVKTLGNGNFLPQ